MKYSELSLNDKFKLPKEDYAKNKIPEDTELQKTRHRKGSCCTPPNNCTYRLKNKLKVAMIKDDQEVIIPSPAIKEPQPKPKLPERKEKMNEIKLSALEVTKYSRFYHNGDLYMFDVGGPSGGGMVAVVGPNGKERLHGQTVVQLPTSVDQEDERRLTGPKTYDMRLQVNGTDHGKMIEIPVDLDKEEIEYRAKFSLKEVLKDKEVVRVIIVPNSLVNVIAKKKETIDEDEEVKVGDNNSSETEAELNESSKRDS